MHSIDQDLRVRRCNGNKLVDQLGKVIDKEPSNETTEAVTDQDQLVRIKDLDETLQILQDCCQGVVAQIVGFV